MPLRKKIFNIMRANKSADIFHTLLELEFKFPLYQQVKFHTFLATRPAFTWCNFIFPVRWTIPSLEVLVYTLRCSEICIVTSCLVMHSRQDFSGLTLTTGLSSLHLFLLSFPLPSHLKDDGNKARFFWGLGFLVGVVRGGVSGLCVYF